jgi:hypothetical protein
MSTVILTFQTSKIFCMKYYADQCHVRRPNYYIFISDGGASVSVGDGGLGLGGGRQKGRWSRENF